MIEDLFEHISRSKKGRLQPSTEEWDGLIDIFNKDTAHLRYSYKNWKVELEGTHTTADLHKPSSLPFGEEIDWISVNIRCSHPNIVGHENFEVTHARTFLKFKAPFLVKSKNGGLKNRLEKSQALLKFYRLPFNPNPEISGKTKGNSFIVESRMFAESNPKELVHALLKALEEVMDILESSHVSKP